MAETQAKEDTSQFQNFIPNFADMAMVIPRIQATALRAVLRQQKEMLTFFDQRCNAEVELAEQISQASDMKEIFEAYSGFLRDAAKDYAEEAKNEAEVGSVTLVDFTSELRAVADITEGQPTAKKAG